jgi:hypothetical protein
MVHGYTLHVVPRDPNFRPAVEQVNQLMQFLVERLQLGESEFSVDGEDELTVGDATERLRAAAKSSRGGTECSVPFDDLLSGGLFGYEQDAPDADENFWADELRIQISGAPFPYGDWEYEDAYCAKCNARIGQIGDLLEELRVSGQPLSCGCGAQTLPSELRMTSGVRLAQLSIAFAGNKGWFHEVDDDRDAFSDDTFLPALEEILGTDLEVLAISH